MLELNGLFIYDDQNNLFKILKFGSGIDKYDEPYVKICFPDNKFGTKLYEINQSGKVVDNYLNQFNYKTIELMEFSYHYIAGVSHFKTSDDRIQQRRNLPTIESKTPIELLSMLIFDLNPISPFQKNPETHDFVLPNKFNIKNGRLIDICLSQVNSAPKLEIKNNINYFGQYEFIDDELNIRLSLIDYEFKVKPENDGIVFHRSRDPQDKFF